MLKERICQTDKQPIMSHTFTCTRKLIRFYETNNKKKTKIKKLNKIRKY